MLHNRCNNTKITLFVRRTFHKKDRSVSIHSKNIQELAVEMFKVKKGLAPEIVQDLLVESDENHHNLNG